MCINVIQLKLEELFEDLLLAMIEEYDAQTEGMPAPEVNRKMDVVDLWKMWKKFKRRARHPKHRRRKFFLCKIKNFYIKNFSNNCYTRNILYINRKITGFSANSYTSSQQWCC